MTTTFADYVPPVAGPRLLPPGTRNFTIVSAIPEINEWNGKRQVIFTLSSAEGSGVYEMDLEASSPQYQDIVDKIVLGVMKVTGFQPSNPNTPITALQQVLIPEFIGALPGLAGTVVELNVVISEYDRKKDGVPVIDESTGLVAKGKRQKVFFNKLVAKGSAPIAAPIAAPAGFAPQDFIAQPDTADDDIPF